MKNHRIAVLIPSTTNVTESASTETVNRWIKNAKTRFAQLFGGFTSYSAVGGWMSPDHGLVEENVTVISSFTDDIGLNRLADVMAFASKMAQSLSQEAVAVEVDHRMEFVSPLAVAA